MRVARAVLALGLLAVVAGCSSAPSPTPPAEPPSPPSPPDLTLCYLLTPQDFRDAGAGTEVSGSVDGDGGAPSVTCTYGPGLEVVAQVLPTVENASAIYRALVGSGWFSADLTQSPVAGVDESLYGTGPDGAAIALRRQTVILLVTMPGTDRQAPLVKLATKALSSLGPRPDAAVWRGKARGRAHSRPGRVSRRSDPYYGVRPGTPGEGDMRSIVAVIMAILGTVLVLSGAAAFWAVALNRTEPSSEPSSRSSSGAEPGRLDQAAGTLARLPRPERLILWGVILLGLSAVAAGAISFSATATAGNR
jgi:hypothetical protein